MDHGLDGRTDELGRVVHDLVVDAFRHVFLELGHGGADVIGDFQCVGAGCLEDWNRYGLLIIEQGAQRVFAGAEFDSRYIFQIRDDTIRRSADHDVAKFFLTGETAAGIYRNLIINPRHRGRSTNHTGGDIDVLLADGVHYVGGS